MPKASAAVVAGILFGFHTSAAAAATAPHLPLGPAGAVGFHSGSGQADSGWGCGFRNIQMQISHQLMRGDAAVRQALFGGCGYVPDIGELLGAEGVSCLGLHSCTSVARLANTSLPLRRWLLVHVVGSPNHVKPTTTLAEA
jgi:hypothetical protein